MTFASPWGLLALLGVPLVLWLHTLRRRLRERRVAGLFLFAPDALAEDAGRTRSPLLRTPSLWLELAATALLALLLAGPSLGTSRAASHLVAVLDDTASMGAVPDGTSVAEDARRELRARLSALPADGTASIVLTGAHPRMLSGPRGSRRAAETALDAWTPVGASADAGPALDLALQLADPEEDVLFLTDEAEPEVPPRVEVAAFGAPRQNVALASARRARSGLDRETLYVDVVSFANAPVETVVSVEAMVGDAAREVGRKEVVVDPARRARVSLEVPRADVALRVHLSGDALALDDEALLLPEPVRTVPYAVAMADATAAALGLGLLEASVPGLARVAETGAALLITDVEGAAPPGTTRLVVRAGGEERDDWLGPFLLDRAHGLVEGWTLEGVVWSAGREPLAGRGLAFVGDRALLAVLVSDGGTTVRMNLDPSRSTLAASADWPIFLSNLVERTRGSLPGATASNVRVGESIVYRARGAGEAEGWRWVDPDGAEEPVPAGGLWVREPRAPGIHRLVSPAGERARWSVVFVDGRESDLRDRGSARRPAKRLPAAAGSSVVVQASTTAPARVLALLVLVLAVTDAWVLARVRRPRGAAR